MISLIEKPLVSSAAVVNRALCSAPSGQINLCFWFTGWSVRPTGPCNRVTHCMERDANAETMGPFIFHLLESFTAKTLVNICNDEILTACSCGDKKWERRCLLKTKGVLMWLMLRVGSEPYLKGVCFCVTQQKNIQCLSAEVGVFKSNNGPTWSISYCVRSF